MEQHDSIVALLSVIGGGTFVLLAAWIGGKFQRQFRVEDQYRDIGRLEGRGNNEPIGPRNNFELAVMLGGLRSGVEMLQGDIAEIKRNQETNRDRQDRHISDLTRTVQTVHSDIDSVKAQLADLRQRVTALSRGMKSVKPPTG